MKLNKEKLYTDILVKLDKENKPKTKLAKELEFTVGVINALERGSDTRISNFFKLITWLDNGIEEYIVHEDYFK